MLENFKTVNNPLTIIAIFAGISEVAGTIVLPLIKPEIQWIFLIFVMGYPVLLLLLFFGVLIFKPKVLYGASDYKDEANFMTALGIKDKFTDELEGIKKDLQETRDLISKKEDGNEEGFNNKNGILIAKVDQLLEKVSEAKVDIQKMMPDDYENKILNVVFNLFKNPGSVHSEGEIISRTGLTRDSTRFALARLAAYGWLTFEGGSTKIWRRTDWEKAVKELAEKST